MRDFGLFLPAAIAHSKLSEKYIVVREECGLT